MIERTAFVAGATGLVGGVLTRLLCDHPAYESVRVAVRRPVPFEHPKLRQEVVDFDRLEGVLNLRGVTDVFCALGTTIRKAGSQEAFRRVDLEYPASLARTAARDGSQRFFLVSSIGAGRESGNFYLRTKGEVESCVREVFPGALHIVRPSLLLGEREEFRIGERIGAVLMSAGAVLMVGPLRKYRPISATDVAGAMVAAAMAGGLGTQTYEFEEIQKLADAFRNS